MASRSKSLDARRAGARRTAAPPVAARGDGSGAGIAGPPPDFDIGARLRAVRRVFGLSQRELAKRAGVTNGTISLIEQNSVSPTIASLRKVLGGLPISLADFFAGDVPRAPKIFFPRAELTTIRGGTSVVIHQVGPTGPADRLQVLHECYAPGGDTGEDFLVHEGEEAGVIVRGRIEVTVGGQTEILGPGDAYAFDSRIPHRFRNVGDEPGEIVSACTPPTF